jgi:hypothetical protein
MRAFEFLLEDEEPAENPDVENMKKVLASKIKQLPTDPKTMGLLQEIEELLANIGAGSRVEVVKGALQQINDAEVNKAQKLLAKYFLSLEASQADKNALLTAWKNDKLININKLTEPGSHTIADIVNGYDSNPAIKEMTDDLSMISFLGQGKGEFLLSVFSKSISKAGKGDLQVDGKMVEVKTREGGAGRFMDQQVKPGSGYQQAANNFKQAYKDIIDSQKLETGTGISLSSIIRIGQSVEPNMKQPFQNNLRNILDQIFTNLPDDSLKGKFVDNVVAGNEKPAKQIYAVMALNNYIEAKDDDGILMIDLTKNPYEFVYFTDNASLNAGGLRLHMSTAYPISGEFRNLYPQTHITRSSGSA